MQGFMKTASIFEFKTLYNGNRKNTNKKKSTRKHSIYNLILSIRIVNSTSVRKRCYKFIQLLVEKGNQRRLHPKHSKRACDYA